MHAARQSFIQNESNLKIEGGLTHQIRASGNDEYTTGNLVFYKRENNKQWHGPGTVRGQGGKAILVKYSSTNIRIHTCLITHAINSDQNEILRQYHNYRSNSGTNESR